MISVSMLALLWYLTMLALALSLMHHAVDCYSAVHCYYYNKHLYYSLICLPHDGNQGFSV